MLILPDHSTPAPLRYFLFEVFVTADKNIRYQQNLAARKIAIVTLGNAQWPVFQ